MEDTNVLMIYTGGTIGMRRSAKGYIPAPGYLLQCMKCRPSFYDLSAEQKQLKVVDVDGQRMMLDSYCIPMSAYGKRVRYSILEYKQLVDSCNIGAAEWQKMATSIEQNYKLWDAFIILHGTDSLAYTCSALSFMLENLGKPVILTGSQVPLLELRNDAADNLLGSLIIAGHFMVPEVCLYFNHRLFRGNRCTKIHANSFQAFDSPNCNPLAKVGIDIKVDWDNVHNPTTLLPLRVQRVLNSNVTCIRLFPGISAQVLRPLISKLRGLVIETFGSGNAAGGPEMVELFREASEKGVVIVNVTQCFKGSVNPVYESGVALSRAGVVCGHDMTSEAALTKLCYLLSLPQLSVDEIRKLMAQAIRGELTEPGELQFSPHKLYSTKRELAMSRLFQAAAEGNLQDLEVTLNLNPEAYVNQSDYSGSTLLHISCLKHQNSVVQFLLEHGASVYHRNNENRTALFVAANVGNLVGVQILRKSGAHLHVDELEAARDAYLRADGPLADIWALAGAASASRQ